MKKNYLRFAAAVSCVAMLAGCGQKENTAEPKETGKTNTQVSVTSKAGKQEIAKQLKVKYAAAETNDYADALYNLPEDHQFVYENVDKNVFSGDLYSDLEVYSDSELKNRVDIRIEEDYDNGRVTVAPGLVFNLNCEDSCSDNDGTWGSRSKFYLVQRRNLETNQELEKPLVTVFTIGREMNTPTLEQSIAKDGSYKLTWTEVEGADYYEVYEYDAGMEYAMLESTENDTECTYLDFQTAKNREEHFHEKYDGTDAEDAFEWSMNEMMTLENFYFVVACTNDGVRSGMSNMCEISQIANKIPVRETFGAEVKYNGDSAMVLPTYTSVDMLDGSCAQMVIDYHGAAVTLFADNLIKIEPSILNLPINKQPLYFIGMEYEDFLKDMENVTDREDKMATKSATWESDIEIPFVPDNGEDNETAGEEETNGEDETAGEDETNDEDETDGEKAVQSNLADTVYAKSAMGEWIALHMLEHEEVIPLDEFPEAADVERLQSTLLEAYHQNPLIDIMTGIDYDYKTNALIVEYIHDAEESRAKQEAALTKAAEIAGTIIKDGMSDFEKEEAINEYLCANASYNDAIYEYINEDGTISDEALKTNADSFLPYGILVNNSGVCESYSEAFLLIAKSAGLDAVIDTGSLSGVNHEWNRVKIDGSWCILDVTNNDNEYIPNCYFNLSEAGAEGILISDADAFTSENYGNYAASDDEKEYYFHKGQYASEAAQAVEVLNGLFKNNSRGAVRIANELGEAEIGGIVQQVCDDSGLSGGKYYYNSGVLSIISE